MAALIVGFTKIDHACKKTRRSKGKSDTLDAENAALTARDFSCGGFRSMNGSVAIDRTSELEDIRIIKAAYDSAISNRTQVINEIKSTVLKARPELRSQLENIKQGKNLAIKCSNLRPEAGQTCDRLIKIALKSKGKLYLELSEIIETYRQLLEEFANAHLKNLLKLKHVGAVNAVSMFVSAGSNVDRFKTTQLSRRIVGLRQFQPLAGKSVTCDSRALVTERRIRFFIRLRLGACAQMSEQKHSSLRKWAKEKPKKMQLGA